MDYLPGKQAVRAFNVGVQVNPAQAAAPWKALGSLGNQIQEAGDQVAGLVVQAKKADTRRRANEMELEFSKMQADYENEMLRNPDPTTWVTGWDERVKAFQSRYQTDGMAPDEQEVIGGRMNQISARSTMNVGRTAAVAIFQADKQSAANLIEEGERTGDEELRSRGFSQLREVVPAAEADKVEMESNRRTAAIQAESAIRANPLEWADKLESDPEATVKAYPGLSVGDIPRLQDMAQSEKRQAIGGSIDTFSDQVATGEITTPEQIDRKFSGSVPPRIIEKMKGELASRYDAAEKARRMSPEYQSEAVGQVTTLLDGIAQSPDFERKYSQAAFLLHSLPDSPIKRQLTSQLKSAKDGVDFVARTKEDVALKALDDLTKARLPKEPEPLKVADAIQAGFLRDTGKLMQLGYSEEQAKSIAEAKNSAEAQTIFRQEWDKRGKADPNVPQTVWQTGAAIRVGADQVSMMSPEQEDAMISARITADRKLGDQKIKLAEWMSQNPDANTEQIQKRAFEISGEHIRVEMSNGILGDETSMNDRAPAGQPLGKDLLETVKTLEAGGAPGGFHRAAYWDYKQWSIGYGTKSKAGEVISQAEADKRLTTELDAARKQVEEAAARYGLKFKPHELDALTSFTYNVGAGEGGLKSLLKDGKRSKAEIADAMLLYRNANGERLAGLEKRRATERTIFLKGYGS